MMAYSEDSVKKAPLLVLLRTFRFRFESSLNDFPPKSVNIKPFKLWDNYYSVLEYADNPWLINILDDVFELWSNCNDDCPFWKFMLNFIKDLFSNDLVINCHKHIIDSALIKYIKFVMENIVDSRSFSHKLNIIEDFKLKFTTLTTISSITSNHFQNLSPDTIMKLFDIICIISSHNNQLHDESLIVIESIIEKIFDALKEYSESTYSSYFKKVKSIIKASHIKILKSSTNNSGFFVGLDCFHNLNSLNGMETENIYLSDDIDVFLSSIVSKINLSPSFELYDCLLSIVMYLSNAIIIDKPENNESQSFKILALKSLNSTINRHHDIIEDSFPSMRAIITNHLMYNITQVLIFFNSPLIDFQFNICLLLNTIIISFENISRMIYIQLNLLINRLSLIVNQIDIDNKVTPFDASQIWSMVGLIHCLITSKNIASDTYITSDMNYYNASIFETIISSLTKLLIFGIDEKLQEKIISLLKNIIINICSETKVNKADQIYSISHIQKKIDVKEKIINIENILLEDPLSVSHETKYVLDYTDNSFEDELANIIMNSKRLNPITNGRLLFNPKLKYLTYPYIVKFNFRGMQFHDALRLVLSKIRLTGDSYEIENYMEIFAEIYLYQNPHCNLSLRALQSMSISALLLNVNEHAPAINNSRIELKRQSFIKAIKNSDETINETIVGKLYDDILKWEIILPYDKGNIPYLALTWYFDIDSIESSMNTDQIRMKLDNPSIAIIFQKLTNNFIRSLITYLIKFNDKNTSKASKIIEFLELLFGLASKLECTTIFDYSLNSIFASLSLFDSFKTTIDFCYQLQNPISFIKLSMIFNLLKNYSHQINCKNPNFLSMIIVFYKFGMIPEKYLKFNEYLSTSIVDHDNSSNISSGLENDNIPNYFSRLFTSQNTENEIKINRTTVINGIKDDIKTKIEDSSSLFYQHDFIILILEAIFRSTQEFIKISRFDLKDDLKLETWLLDFAFMCISSFLKSQKNTQESKQMLLQGVFGILKKKFVLDNKEMISDFLGSQFFIRRLVDNLSSLFLAIDHNDNFTKINGELIIQIIKLSQNNSNKVKLCFIESLKIILSKISTSNFLIFEMLLNLCHSLSIDDLTISIIDLYIDLMKKYVSLNDFNTSESFKQIIDILIGLIDLNNKIYHDAMPIFKKQNTAGYTLEDQEFKIPNSFLIDLQLLHLEFFNILEYCLHRLSEKIETTKSNIENISNILITLMKSITNKRLKISNDAIQKIATCFQHLFNTSSYDDLSYFFKFSIIDSFDKYAKLISDKSNEEVLLRTINQISQIYLNYFLPHELKEPATNATLNDEKKDDEENQKPVIFGLLLSYLSSLHSLKCQSENSDLTDTLHENLRNIMLVINEGAQKWQRDYLIENLEKFRFSNSEKKIVNEIFAK